MYFEVVPYVNTEIFKGSFRLTCISFFLPATQFFSTKVLIPLLVFLAIVQLIYYMHLGTEHKPRWMMLVFNFMVLVILIVVLGSLWIISDLNHSVMPEMPNMSM